MANALDEAASLLRNRIRELDSERKKLERALSNLTGGRLGRRGPGRPPKSARPNRPPPRVAVVVGAVPARTRPSA